MLTRNAIFYLLFFSLKCSAQLQWSNKSVEFDADAGTGTVTGKYSFTNISGRTVHIASIGTSCDCAQAQIAKLTYQPGESGQVNVTYEVKDKSETVRLLTTVAFDTPAEFSAELQLMVRVTCRVDCNTHVLLWSVGEAGTAKAIDIFAATNEDVRGITLPAGETRLKSIILETVNPGRHYRVVMTPKSTAAPEMIILHSIAILSNERKIPLTLCALIK